MFLHLCFCPDICGLCVSFLLSFTPSSLLSFLFSLFLCSCHDICFHLIYFWWEHLYLKFLLTSIYCVDQFSLTSFYLFWDLCPPGCAELRTGCFVSAWSLPGEWGKEEVQMELWVVVVAGWFLLFFYNFVCTVALEFMTPKLGYILFPWVASSKAWIISPIQSRIIGTICPDVCFPHLTHPLPAATLTLLPEKTGKIQRVWPLCYFSEVQDGWVDFQLGFSMCLLPLTPSVGLVWFIFSCIFLSGKSLYIVWDYQLVEYHAVILLFLSFPRLLSMKNKQPHRQFFIFLECCLVVWRSFYSRETFWTPLHLPTHPLVLFSSGSVVTKVTTRVYHNLPTTSDIFLSGLILWGRKKGLTRLGALHLFLGNFFSDHYF